MAHDSDEMVTLQVAGDANANGQVYPDQSLYAANSVPQMVKRINQVAFLSRSKSCHPSAWGISDREMERSSYMSPFCLHYNASTHIGYLHQMMLTHNPLQALQRADQIEHAEGGAKRDWFAPIVADAEAGFGGQLNVYELMKSMIEAGAAGVHLEDQLASEKKCGHLGGKVASPSKASFAQR